MGKHFLRLNPGALAQPFHIPPDVAPINGFPAARYEHRPGGDFLCPEIFFQKSAQLAREKDGAPLPLVVDLGPAGLHRLNGNIAQLGHSDASGANGLDDEGKTLIFLLLSGADQAGVLSAGQLLVGVTEDGLLDFQQLDFALAPAHKGEKAIDGGDHAVDRGRGVVGGQSFFPGNQRRLGEGLAIHPRKQSGEIVDVLLNGDRGALLLLQIADIAADVAGGKIVGFSAHSSVLLKMQIPLLYRSDRLICTAPQPTV